MTLVASKYWRCAYCDKSFYNGPDMLQHLEQKHGITKDKIVFYSHEEWRLSDKTSR